MANKFATLFAPMIALSGWLKFFFFSSFLGNLKVLFVHTLLSFEFYYVI